MWDRVQAMSRLGPLLAAVSLCCVSPAVAQVTPTMAYCSAASSSGQGGVVSVVFEYGPGIMAYTSQIMDVWRGGGFEPVSCVDSTLEEITRWQRNRVSMGYTVLPSLGNEPVDPVVLRERAREAEERQRQVEAEIRRLGAHRAAEAERLVAMREAAERARRRRAQQRGCLPTARVTCE